jgi:hypothetical protein
VHLCLGHRTPGRLLRKKPTMMTHDACQRPQACRLHGRYVRNLHEKLFVMKIFPIH